MKWIKVFIFFSLFFMVERFCHKKTHGFRIQKIQSTLAGCHDWETKTPTDEEMDRIDHTLSQPYYFLGSGGQSYAFISHDKKTVLKLFKHHHMRPISPIDDVPLPKFLASIRNKYRKEHQNRLNAFFLSCKEASERFKEETGLIFLHLNKTDNLKKKLTLYDPIGVKHTLDLDKIEFALQKKATLAYPTLAALIEAGEIDAAKVRLSSLLHLIEKRCLAGLADHDPRKRNFGFVGENAIEIDLGSFTVEESLKTPAACKKILLFETMKLRRWIKKNYPDLSPFLEEEIKEIVKMET